MTQALVGRFHGRTISEQSLKQWIQVEWEPRIGYVPVFYILTRGQMDFLFQNATDADKFLNSPQKWGGPTPLSIKMWSPFFDVRLEQTILLPVWVQLPSLPIDFWFVEVFKEIGNSLGSFIEADMSFLESNSLDEPLVRGEGPELWLREGRTQIMKKPEEKGSGNHK